MVMCQWVQNRLPAYLAGDLGARPARWLKWHLDQCHVCQRALRTIRGMQGLVSRALQTGARAPETLNARVMAAIAELPTAHAPPRRRSRLFFWRR